MAEIINLRCARKQKRRQSAADAAAENRAASGLTKHQKTLQKKEKAQLAKKLDAHKRDKDDDR